MSVITGLGLLTPLGASVDQTWQRLLAGDFITDHARAGGEYDRSSPRVIQMARRAAGQALSEAGWSPRDEFATVVGTSKGSIESWLVDTPDAAGRLDPAGLADMAVAIGSGGGGPRLTVSGACASGLLALIRGAMMIRGGEARRVLVVAAEASVHPLFIGSFMRLGVLPAPGVGCRPFDEARDGFLMSEAAAAICLEAEGEFGATGHGAERLRPVAIEHFAMGGDAVHLTAADPQGRVLRALLSRVVGHEPVDLVHAHGTGTAHNDPIELAAIESTFAGAPFPAPSLYSHKGALGHSLGAAGLVAVVLNALAHRHGIVPPNVRTARPLPARAVHIDREPRQRSIRRSIAIASGFGGASAALSLRST